MANGSLRWHKVQAGIWMLLMIAFNAYHAIRSLIELFFNESVRLSTAQVPGLAAVVIVKALVALYLCWHCWEARGALLRFEPNAVNELHDVYVYDLALTAAYVIAVNVCYGRSPAGFEIELTELIEMLCYIVLLFVNSRYYPSRMQLFEKRNPD